MGRGGKENPTKLPIGAGTDLSVFNSLFSLTRTLITIHPLLGGRLRCNCRSFVPVLYSPEPSAMCLDDRSTNGKPQSHALCLCSKKIGFCRKIRQQIYLTFTMISVMSSCWEARPCHSNTFAITLAANSRAGNRRDSTTIDRNFSSSNSTPAGFRASVTPSV
ncbi:MAG: hypothetical protein QOJ02_73 [Acidobacteriota bacterium]|nr:hypothetical protein [Acidobacteriota bacterium]